MEREDIKQAADTGVENYVSENKLMGFRGSYKRGFIEGAEWRINYIWHDASGQPEKSERYILIDSISYDGIRCYNVICAKYYEENPFNERWAYIEDLLPTNNG